MRYTLTTVYAFYRYYRAGYDDYPNPRRYALRHALAELPGAWRVARFKKVHG